MIITKLSLQQRNDQRVNIFVDEKYAFSLTVRQVSELGLKKGAEVDETQLTQLKRESSFGKLYARALARALSRPHSRREMLKYLQRAAQRRYQDLDESAFEAIVMKLASLRYVDDEQFAQYWVEMRRRHKWSVKSIAFELRRKGVSDEITRRVLSRDGDRDRENLRLLIEKKRGKYDSQEKLMRYLASKGFEFDDIKAMLVEYNDGS